MSDADDADAFEAHFSRMGLAALPADVPCDATFASGDGNTLQSAPRAELAPLDAAHAGTLPQLTFATPDAAGEEGTGAPELVVVEVLGEGGMGQVLLARQHSLGREVAVKILKPGSNNALAAAALVEEARTTGSLEHPGVVPVYALARDSRGLPALVMKRVDGVSWRALLRDDNHPSWSRIDRARDRLEANLEVLIQVCNAVAHAHKRGVIHRDLKPANILIGELGEVYVADWGVAIQKANLKPGPPQLVGTPAYLAPEMVTGDASLTDERTDIYLLGGTLLEAITRRPPHLGASIHDVLQKAWASAPPALPPEVPGELAAICLRALAPDPRDRFQTAVELRDALRLFLQHRGSIHLANAAAARLKKLEVMAMSPLTAEQERGWYALVSECRFGFTQALEADPQSAVARVCLDRCLEVATVRELERGAPQAARAFFVEMAAPPPAVETALRALEAKEAERVRREAQHQQNVHQLDPRVSLRQRNGVIAALAVSTVAIVLMFGTISAVPAFFQAHIGRFARLVPMGLMCLVFVVSVLVGRKALLATRINRQLMALIGIGVFSMELGRLQFLLMDVSLRVSLVHDALMMAAVLAACAFLLHWGFAVPGALFALSGVAVSLAAPEHAVIVFSVGGFVAMVSSAFMFRAWEKDLLAAPKGP